MSDDDQKLFRRAMRDARPLDTEPRAPQGPRPPARARSGQADDDALLREAPGADTDIFDEYSGDALRFQRPSVSRRSMRRLARGRYAVQGEIDLHGMTASEARHRLAEFVDDAARRGWRCVRVVHGKGLGSGERGAVLKPNVDRWLRRWEPVLAFVSTRPVDGGTGAIHVLLKGR